MLSSYGYRRYIIYIYRFVNYTLFLFRRVCLFFFLARPPARQPRTIPSRKTVALQLSPEWCRYYYKDTIEYIGIKYPCINIYIYKRKLETRLVSIRIKLYHIIIVACVYLRTCYNTRGKRFTKGKSNSAEKPVFFPSALLIFHTVPTFYFFSNFIFSGFIT